MSVRREHVCVLHERGPAPAVAVAASSLAQYAALVLMALVGECTAWPGLCELGGVSLRWIHPVAACV